MIKPETSVRTQIRLPKELHDKLTHLADKNNVSLNRAMIYYLEIGISADDPDVELHKIKMKPESFDALMNELNALSDRIRSAKEASEKTSTPKTPPNKDEDFT